MRQSAHGILIPVLIGILKVVTGISLIILVLYNLSFYNSLRYGENLLIGQSGKDLLRSSILKSDECDPFLLVIVELYNITVKYFRTLRSFDM